jgi:F-type H+-transporting ATPase subunit delta
MSFSNVAKALFEIAKEAQKIDTLTYHFEDFKDTVEKHPEWLVLMDSPMVDFKEKVKMIDALEYDVSFLAFLKTLVSKSLIYEYKEIYTEWIHLTRIHHKIAHLHIYSAKPVSKETEAKLKKAIEPRFPNQKVELHITIDPNLLGGLKIVYQGQSLDRSIARELEELYLTI